MVSEEKIQVLFFKIIFYGQFKNLLFLVMVAILLEGGPVVLNFNLKEDHPRTISDKVGLIW